VKEFDITDERMTRFWITLDQGVNFVTKCIDIMSGGEVFIPKIPSMNIIDLANAIAPKTKVRIIGTRPGEKLHEVLVSEEESAMSYEYNNMFVIRSGSLFREPHNPLWKKGKKMEIRSYASDNNTEWLDKKGILEMIHQV
jgi:UDP-N-acetylglucosamine 4,6-dehydratase